MSDPLARIPVIRVLCTPMTQYSTHHWGHTYKGAKGVRDYRICVRCNTAVYKNEHARLWAHGTMEKDRRIP